LDTVYVDNTNKASTITQLNYNKYCNEYKGFFDYCYYSQAHRYSFVLQSLRYYRGQKTQSSNKCVTTGGNGYCCTHGNAKKVSYVSSCGTIGTDVWYK